MTDLSIIPDNDYKLLTPGPLSTTKSVRAAMLKDFCTWDKGYNKIVSEIRTSLLRLAMGDINYEKKKDDYSVVLMQGSGTFAIESVIGSAVSRKGKILFFTNGAYGKRMVKIAEALNIDYAEIGFREDQPISGDDLDKAFAAHHDATHVAIVHCETTTGILNPLETVALLSKKNGMSLIVDAMSSFGGVPIDMPFLNIDFLISSANKCIQGVPGFGFVIARKEALENTRGNARSYSLDLYDQWRHMEDYQGKWRFTSPTHSVIAFRQAILELKEEGGVDFRYQRYKKSQETLVAELRKLDLHPFIEDRHHSPVITTFLCPRESNFSFSLFYETLKKNGFVIYPGKLTDIDTFRIGNIGDVCEADILRLAKIIKENIFWK